MFKHYSYNEDDSMSDIKYIDFATAFYFKDYPNNLLLIKYLLKELFYISSGYIKLLNESFDDKNIRKASLQIVSGKRVLNLTNSYNEITIASKNISYKFLVLPFLRPEANLIEISEVKKDRIITKRFQDYLLEVQIEFCDKEFFFSIPLDKANYIIMDFFDSLNKNSSILDLRKFYTKNIYGIQTIYNRSNFPTILRISEVFEGNVFPIDELVLINNEVKNYKLGIIKDGVEIILKDGIYTVIGMDLNENNEQNIDLNALFDNLAIRRRNIK